MGSYENIYSTKKLALLAACVTLTSISSLTFAAGTLSHKVKIGKKDSMCSSWSGAHCTNVRYVYHMMATNTTDTIYYGTWKNGTCTNLKVLFPQSYMPWGAVANDHSVIISDFVALFSFPQNATCGVTKFTIGGRSATDTYQLINAKNGQHVSSWPSTSYITVN